MRRVGPVARYRRLGKGLRHWQEHILDTVRVTGHKTPGEFSVILQLVVMIQLTSRRILRD